ncbi:MAG: hypothetical protein PHF56_13715 [Desulfuromonadaceae bacterium]|nr:hypothetical protein [Desulfuromonadaceae bacterium]
MAEFDALHKLANRLQALKKQAKALGMFINDREFLECPNCVLKESLASENTLYTYRYVAIDDDTGLHFPESDEDGKSVCPECGATVKGEWL